MEHVLEAWCCSERLTCINSLNFPCHAWFISVPIFQMRKQIQRGLIIHIRPHSKWPCQMKNSGSSVFVCVSAGVERQTSRKSQARGKVAQVPGTVRLDYQMMPVLQKRRQIQRGWVTYRRPHSKWPCQMKNSGRSVCVYVCVSVLTGV